MGRKFASILVITIIAAAIIYIIARALRKALSYG